MRTADRRTRLGEQEPSQVTPEIPAPSEEPGVPSVTVPVEAGFPIVGIGASAGGLAAFEAFFSAMPADTESGMAFFLVRVIALTMFDDPEKEVAHAGAIGYMAKGGPLRPPAAIRACCGRRGDTIFPPPAPHDTHEPLKAKEGDTCWQASGSAASSPTDGGGCG
jgi:hypothetical protein